VPAITVPSATPPTTVPKYGRRTQGRTVVPGTWTFTLPPLPPPPKPAIPLPPMPANVASKLRQIHANLRRIVLRPKLFVSVGLLSSLPRAAKANTLSASILFKKLNSSRLDCSPNLFAGLFTTS
jgi:hypothetical protein